MIISSLHFELPFSHSFPPFSMFFFVVTWGARELINKPTMFRDLDLEVKVNTFVGLFFQSRVQVFSLTLTQICRLFFFGV